MTDLQAAGLVLLLPILAGCGSTSGGKQTGTISVMENYRRALIATQPNERNTLPMDSDAQRHAIETFKAFYSEFSTERVQSGLRTIYGADAYFCDGFKEVQGIDQIEAYFLSSAEGVASCTFDIEDVAVVNGEYYYRWSMKLYTRRNPTRLIEAVGMSHVRVNENGFVVFHQDYWDTSLVYETVPLLGTVIRHIRNRF